MNISDFNYADIGSGVFVLQKFALHGYVKLLKSVRFFLDNYIEI